MVMPLDDKTSLMDSAIDSRAKDADEAAKMKELMGAMMGAMNMTREQSVLSGRRLLYTLFSAMALSGGQGQRVGGRHIQALKDYDCTVDKVLVELIVRG
jgi:hypothetical protein